MGTEGKTDRWNEFPVHCILQPHAWIDAYRCIQRQFRVGEKEVPAGVIQEHCCLKIVVVMKPESDLLQIPLLFEAKMQVVSVLFPRCGQELEVSGGIELCTPQPVHSIDQVLITADPTRTESQFSFDQSKRSQLRGWNVQLIQIKAVPLCVLMHGFQRNFSS